MADPIIIDEVQLEYLVAAILASGTSAADKVSAETSVAYYRRALKKLRERGLDALPD
tara:strand:+ start:550 stop:720 length:171 start_codon:yes stop_codon:yes gene_type:complete